MAEAAPPPPPAPAPPGAALMPSPEMVTVTRPRTPPDELRCTRNDGKLWRCKHRKRPDHPLCELHYTVRRTTPSRPRGTPTRSEKDVWPNGRRGRCHPRKPPAPPADAAAKRTRKPSAAGAEKRKRNRKAPPVVDQPSICEDTEQAEESSGPPVIVRFGKGVERDLTEVCSDLPVTDPPGNSEELELTEVRDDQSLDTSKSDRSSTQEETKETTLQPEASDSNFFMSTSDRETAFESSARLIQNPECTTCSCSSKFSVTVCMEEMKKYLDIPVSKRLRAMQELQSESWRETFICMDDETRRAWIERFE